MDDFFLIISKIFFIIIIVILVDIIINMIINRLNNIAKGKKKSAQTSIRIIKRLKSVILYIFAIIASLFQIPGLHSISWSILSGAGIISLILGYAAQKTLSNFFCGIGIAFSDPFEIGDYIKCVDIDLNGYVEDITLRHTIIRTIDNKRIIIPNARMDEMTIENYNHTDNEVCRFAEYGISYDSDVDKAIKILKEEMDKLYNPNTNGINKHVEFPKVRVIKWDESSIIIRGWIWGADNAMTHENIFHLNYIIKKRFDAEGIEIPYNYLNVVDRTVRKTKKKKNTIHK